MKKQKPYQNKRQLKQAYEKFGSTRRAARFFGVTNGTIIRWMRHFHLPRIPKLYLYDNHSGWGRLAEKYISRHPYFRKYFRDVGDFDDKSKYDALWYWDRVNVKSTHSKGKKCFRIKKKKHDVAYYICCVYDDKIDPLIPIEVFIIPASDAPRTTITVSLKTSCKYAKFRLSLQRGKAFSIKDEIKYNEQFKNIYKYPKLK